MRPHHRRPARLTPGRPAGWSWLLLVLALLTIPTVGHGQARPRAATPAELEARGLMGRFRGQDPNVLNRAWRIGRDPQTCVAAHSLNLLYRGSLAGLNEGLREATTAGGNVASQVRLYELAIAGALEFMGRPAEAERFLRQRIATPIPVGQDANYNTRLEDLNERLAQLYANTRPAEAERILQQIARDRVARSKALFDGQSRGYPVGGAAWTYEKIQFDMRSTAAVERTLEPFYRQTGRLDEALRLREAAIAAVQKRADQLAARGDRDPPTDLESRRAGAIRLRAEIADAQGRDAEAEARYRACCIASPEHARLLIRMGRREETRLMLAA